MTVSCAVLCAHTVRYISTFTVSVGFIEDSIKLNATNPRISVCVGILTPLRDIHQDTSIPLSVTIDNSTSIPSGEQKLANILRFH